MLTRTLAVELGPLGITINNIAPGAIETPINAKLLNDPVKLASLKGADSARPPRQAGRRLGPGRVPRLRRGRLRDRLHLPGRRRPDRLLPGAVGPSATWPSASRIARSTGASPCSRSSPAGDAGSSGGWARNRGCDAAMRLRGVDEERVAQVDGAGLAGRQDLAAVRRLGEAVGGHLAQRQAGLAGRSQQARHVDDASRRGSASARRPSPTSENRNSISSARPRDRTLTRQFEEVGIVVAEAGVDVPAGVAGIVRRREADRERAQAVAPQPASRADQS